MIFMRQPWQRKSKKIQKMVFDIKILDFQQIICRLVCGMGHNIIEHGRKVQMPCEKWRSMDDK